MSNSQHHALDSRHKASLQKFIDKNDWIQSKIAQLESSSLPAIDAPDAIDETSLSQLIVEHDRTEAQVQELDNGELRALRLLAKAATQKNLSPEDTDLIDITLQVLLSVDKLLHLLRIRGKGLHLLRLKNKWTALTDKVETDLDQLVHNILPTFTRKARWSEPQDVFKDDKRKIRLSDASLSSVTSKPISPSSLRATTTTSSAMSRQMRGEILSLDLASLISRIHTLSYSTLTSSAKILDAMVDAAPVPLPESFLDKQDDLEARVKRDLQGVGDFCHALAKQWRQVDDAYWTCKEVQSASEGLNRDIAQATLKLPSDSLAKEYEDRLETLLTTFSEVSDSAVDKLSLPSLEAHIPDQGMCNLQVTDAMRAFILETSKATNEAQQAVQAYRRAAKALVAAQTYGQEVTETLARLRQASRTLVLMPVELSIVIDEIIDLQAARGKCVLLAEQARRAQDGVASQAQIVIQELLATGIDPNVRRSLQDSVLALTREAKQALGTAENEIQKIDALREARDLRLALEVDVDTLKREKETIVMAIKTVLSAENQSSLATDLENVKQRLGDLHEQLRLHRQSYITATDSLNRLEVTSSPDERVKIASSLQTQLDDLANSLRNADALADLLQRALKQRTEIDTAALEATQLETELRQLQDHLDTASLSDTDLRQLHDRQSQLERRSRAFGTSLVKEISFLAGTVPEADLDLEAHDRAVRERFNQRSSDLSSLLSSVEQSGASLRNALDAFDSLRQQQSNINKTLAQAKAIKTNSEIEDMDKLAQLQVLKQNMGDFASDSRHQESTPSHTVYSKRILEDLSNLRASNISELLSVSERLDAIIEEYAARVSAEEARQVKVQQEEEQRQKRQEAEHLAEKVQAEVDTFQRACQSLQNDIEKTTSQLEESVWDGQPEDAKRMDDYQTLLEEKRSKTEDLQHQLNMLLQTRDLEAMAGFEDLQAKSNQVQESAQNSAMNVFEAVKQAEKACVAAQVANADASQKRQEAEELAAKQEALDQILSSTEAIESMIKSREDAIVSKTAAVEACSDSEELDNLDVRDLETLHLLNTGALLDRFAEISGIDEDSQSTESIRKRLENLLRREKELESRTLALQSLLQDHSQALQARPATSEQPVPLDEGQSTSKESLADATAAQQSSDPASGPMLEVSSTSEDTEDHDATESIRAEDVFGPQLSTDGVTDHLTAAKAAILGSSPESVCSSLPAEEDLTVQLPFDPSAVAAAVSTIPMVGDPPATPTTVTATPLSSESEDNQKKMAFERAVAVVDEAIGQLMDIIDLEDAVHHADPAVQGATKKAEEAIIDVEAIALTIPDDARVQSRLKGMKTVWRELHEHLQRPEEPEQSDVTVTASLSEKSSTSSFSVSSQRSASSHGPKRSMSSASQSAARRIASVHSTSRLPTSIPRPRKESTVSLPSNDVVSPPPSRLPRPMSSASHHFQSPTLASTSRRTPGLKTYHALSPLGAPRLPTPIAGRSIHTHAREEEIPIASPVRRKRSSNRRSGAFTPSSGTAKPNSYQAKPNHKLDTAVGHIVNNMQVPVSITPAEVHHDEVGKYWIGDPPKLYYARILQSRTVMLRVGGGWQELGSFLSTHYDQLFATLDGAMAIKSEEPLDTPTVYTTDNHANQDLWLSASSLKSSHSRSASRRQSFKSPRSTSLHMSPFKHSVSGSDVPFDLTALLMKSTSRSPPAPRAGTSHSQRNISAPAPWRI